MSQKEIDKTVTEMMKTIDKQLGDLKKLLEKQKIAEEQERLRKIQVRFIAMPRTFFKFIYPQTKPDFHQPLGWQWVVSYGQ